VAGRLLVPSFVVSAAAPFAYAVVMERFGAPAVIHVSLGVSLAVLAAGAMRGTPRQAGTRATAREGRSKR
jgi:hypothetical protein